MATVLRWFLLELGFVALGFWLTRNGTTTWDSYQHLVRADWLLSRFNLPTHGLESAINPILAAYGPLWSLALGALAIPFRALGEAADPSWVQTSLNFALFPTTLAWTYRFLRRMGYSAATTAVGVTALLSLIRWGGHSISNVTDFPLACFFLIAALASWRWLRDARSNRDAGPGTGAERSILGPALLCAATFLIRPPMALPSVLLIAALWIWRRDLAARARVRASLICALALVAGAFALWPYLWDRGPAGLLEAFGLFRRFPLVYATRFYGVDAASDRLPLHYTLIWLPLILTPAGLLAVLGGLAGHARRPSPTPAPPSTPRSRVPLPLWLIGWSALAWLGIALARPSLYDEERHFLFLFPPLVLGCALGWDELPKKWRLAMAAACAITALASYASWGRYAYVYRSPAVGPTTSQDFTGDYWAICVSPAIRTLLGGAPPPSRTLVVLGPVENAALQLGRYPGGRSFEVRTAPPANAPFLVLATNRLGANAALLADIKAGRARLVDIQTMPGAGTADAEPACVIASY